VSSGGLFFDRIIKFEGKIKNAKLMHVSLIFKIYAQKKRIISAGLFI